MPSFKGRHRYTHIVIPCIKIIASLAISQDQFKGIFIRITWVEAVVKGTILFPIIIYHIPHHFTCFS